MEVLSLTCTTRVVSSQNTCLLHFDVCHGKHSDSLFEVKPPHFYLVLIIVILFLYYFYLSLVFWFSVKVPGGSEKVPWGSGWFRLGSG